jgi:hypothetical protein
LSTGVGILSSWALYREFGINIFDYAEIGDFLLAAFKSPSALYNFMYALITVSLVPATIVLTPRLARWLTRLIAPPSRRLEGHFYQLSVFAYGLLMPIVTVSLTIFWFVVGITAGSTGEAQAIKHGEKPLVVVQYRSFSSSAGQVTKPGLVLIGATQRFVFFYDVDNKHTLVVPQAQVVSIEVPGNS